MSTIKFILYFTILNIFFYNLPLYRYSINNLNVDSTSFFLILFTITITLFAISSFIFFLSSLIMHRVLLKTFLIIIVISNSVALYFVDTYNVVLDKTMMGNVFNTNQSEAFSYYDISLVFYILILGIIPAIIIYKVNIIKSRFLHLLTLPIYIILITIGFLYSFSNTWLWFDKHAKILGGLTMPWSYIINTVRYKKNELKKNKKATLLPDAKVLNNEEKLVVLIIGESARAASFFLYGYEKETNPKLVKQNIKILKKTLSATTYTTASIHSMFSYQGSTSDNFEALPNYLNRQGVDVLWRANNWGQPKLNIQNYETASQINCKGEGCSYDEVLLSNLKEKIYKLKKKKKFVVLHTSGSHGASYFKKYPEKFEVFKPVCKSVDLSSCTKEELFNVYDNTIVYTDYFINRAIEILKQIDIPSTLIYISDHGESLGENGLYLHGTPYSIAPSFQKEIPFIIWQSSHLNYSIKEKEEYGHFHIFHTVMNALDLRSPIYKEENNLILNKEESE